MICTCYRLCTIQQTHLCLRATVTIRDIGRHRPTRPQKQLLQAVSDEVILHGAARSCIFSIRVRRCCALVARMCYIQYPSPCCVVHRRCAMRAAVASVRPATIRLNTHSRAVPPLFHLFPHKLTPLFSDLLDRLLHSMKAGIYKCLVYTRYAS